MDATAEEINAAGGVLGGMKFEIVHFDNKASAQESVLLLKQVIDSGIRYVTQGGGSNVAHALSEALAKHNSRNPDSSVLYLNYAAQDPALTNEKCNFWHFRFDAHVDMKLEAITNYIAQQKSIKKVYLLNQDYAFGQAISRAAREMLARKRPDIEIVGDDLHPLGKVKDFSPYISKIKASGTETIITGNWGTDFTLLIKASKDSGLGATFYTFNAQNAGAPSSIGAAGADHIKQVFTWHSNIADNRAEAFANDYHRKYKDDFYYNTAKTELEMLARAMNEAKSIDPLKVAKALEGMKYQSDTGLVGCAPTITVDAADLHRHVHQGGRQGCAPRCRGHRLRLEDRHPRRAEGYGAADDLQDGAAIRTSIAAAIVTDAGTRPRSPEIALHAY
jgi:branched-chain amino acid transport system substrate-binding protein